MRVVAISGYFNPIHSGHIDYIQAAKQLGDVLIVIVNSDEQVKLKGSVPFQSEQERQKIASSIKGVDHAVISIDKDGTVCETLKQQYIKYGNDYFFESMTFCNGGDRKEGGVPEDVLTSQLGIRMAYNVGGEKVQSSSNLISKAKHNA
jgi:cytidyltransferase-like protein|tara:strand:+ start:20 stop:463 length:444 start_codon:yes stop_codon:yes gene_type:complete